MDGENFLIPGLTPSQQQQLMALLNGQEAPGGNPSTNMATSNFSGKTENGWIVDTGATNHITHDVNSLSNVEQQHNIPPVQIPDGKTVLVHALGQITLGKRLILDQVLGVPNFCFNLMATIPVQSTVWKLNSYSGQYDVTTGGVEGNPGRETIENWFKIEKYEDDYKLVFCPTVCNYCKVICKGVGILIQNGRRQLTLSNVPFKVMFKKA
ncbi:hypothetical protein RJ639_020839 [Escallonia herrerae]|uniref:Uncharacterized protein n=1 Tax=Escallonia herrerae TaxID=1293975 RepID=A0AA88V410_9ASTE|nr:hypothetical protein RJ639_020839 [Escallonia herrerae]